MADFDISPYGLVWKNPQTRKTIPIPLKSVSITASVVHAVAQVGITQFYENNENTPIEASYIFPVDSNGAVTYFQAELDGKVIKVENLFRIYVLGSGNTGLKFLLSTLLPDRV